MFSIWEIESQSALFPPCLPCCCPLTGLVWKDTGRSCSLLERACSFWIPRVGDLLLRTTESFWPSWSDLLGTVLSDCLWVSRNSWAFWLEWFLASPCPQQNPVFLSTPSCCLQLWAPALERLSVCCSAVAMVWQHEQYFVAIFQS